MIRTESTYTLQRFGTYEQLDEAIRNFCKNKKILSITPFTHACEKCKGEDVGYLIVWDDMVERNKIKISAEIATDAKGKENRIMIYIKDADTAPEYIAYIKPHEFGLRKEVADEIVHRINGGER
jgi:hypothetical protein